MDPARLPLEPLEPRYTGREATMPDGRRSGSQAGWLCALAGTLLATAAGGSALPTTSQVFRSGIDLVTLTATVVDESGRFVTGLTREDFVIAEDGLPQQLSQFTADRVPVSLGIVLDVSGSMRGKRIEDARLALDQFVLYLLDPRDETFVVTFNHKPRIEAAWTRQSSVLAHRLDGVKPNGGTAMYDALMASIPMLSSGTHPKRAIVLVTDGADTASDSSVRAVRALLRRSDALIYAIGIDAPHARRRDDRVDPYVLRAITDETGGGTEVVRDSEDLRAATARIAEELNRQYLLGYSPARPPDGTYRSIRVRIADRPYRVRTRLGYNALPASR